MIRLQSRTFEGLWRFGLHAVPRSRGVVALVERSLSGAFCVLDAVASDDMHAATRSFVDQRRLESNLRGTIVGIAILAVGDYGEACQIARNLIGHCQADAGCIAPREPEPLLSGETLREMASASAMRALRLD